MGQVDPFENHVLDRNTKKPYNWKLFELRIVIWSNVYKWSLSSGTQDIITWKKGRKKLILAISNPKRVDMP